MWSGPRNISTALMRSWGNRPDTIVCDEPFYAHYLIATGLDHPGRDEVIANQEHDWNKIADVMTGSIPGNKSIYYQKHMAHHLLPMMGRDWLDLVTNAFLIRHPAEMIVSLSKVLPRVRLEDTGLPQQVEIFEFVRRRTGMIPPVIDSRDVLQNPRQVLELLCQSLEVPFSDAMLAWPAGRRDTDGIWARHWYANVEKSTGFEPYTPKAQTVPEPLSGILLDCMSLYETLYEHRLVS
jgi:Sulfotransferase domain